MVWLALNRLGTQILDKSDIQMAITSLVAFGTNFKWHLKKKIHSIHNGLKTPLIVSEMPKLYHFEWMVWPLEYWTLNYSYFQSFGCPVYGSSFCGCSVLYEKGHNTGFELTTCLNDQWQDSGITWREHGKTLESRSFTDVKAHISRRKNPNIGALKLIVSCVRCFKSCVQYAKMINKDCKLWCK